MRRYESLDSIRGIAALSVVFGHMFIIYPVFYNILSLNKSTDPVVNLLAFTPLHLLWAGHEAVMLFFILSGFVLSLPYLNDRKLIFKKYVVQRFFRIYIPYIVIIFISILLQSALYSAGGITGLSSWFNWMWGLPFDFNILINFLLMSGDLTHNYDTVAWSLVHEMRISLFFPFIVFFIKKTTIFEDIGIMVLLFLSRSAFPADIPYKLDDTFYYVLFFVLGAVLAKNIHTIGTLFEKAGKLTKSALLMAAFLLYGVHWNLGLLIPESNPLWAYLRNKELTDLATAAASCVLFVFAIHSTKAEKILTTRVPLFLGKISYSLYLVHPVVLLTLMYSLNSYLDPLIIVLMVPPVSIVVASFYHKWIETTAMKTGKLITSKEWTLPRRSALKEEAVKGK